TEKGWCGYDEIIAGRPDCRIRHRAIDKELLLNESGTAAKMKEHVRWVDSLSDRMRNVMAQAIVDPAEIRRFAHHLKQFSEELKDRMAVLHGQLTGLGDTWRDQE